MINQNASPKGSSIIINNRVPAATRYLSISLLLFCSLTTWAQPRYSPEVRSKKEIQWLKDSLQINEVQLNKISAISLSYQQDMDKAANQPDKKKRQARLMKKKDAEMKTILDHGQYIRYYNREELIRKQDARVYKGHQPM